MPTDQRGNHGVPGPMVHADDCAMSFGWASTVMRPELEQLSDAAFLSLCLIVLVDPVVLFEVAANVE
jgi:hypothetical protein